MVRQRVRDFLEDSCGKKSSVSFYFPFQRSTVDKRPHTCFQLSEDILEVLYGEKSFQRPRKKGNYLKVLCRKRTFCWRSPKDRSLTTGPLQKSDFPEFSKDMRLSRIKRGLEKTKVGDSLKVFQRKKTFQMFSRDMSIF